MYDTKVRSFLRPFFRLEVIRSTSEFNDGIYNRSSCASVRLRDQTKTLCRGYVLLGIRGEDDDSVLEGLEKVESRWQTWLGWMTCPKGSLSFLQKQGYYRALLSEWRFVTRMISLRVFLHFCVGYRHTNQELFIGKSSLERILKKSQKSII